MADTLKCPVEGCAHAPFKNLAGLNSHISSVHPGYEPGGEGAREVPIVEEDFATLLKKFRIKGGLAANIAQNVSHTGGPKVFEEPELLFKHLTTWSSDILPGKRKNIIEQWFAEKGIDISPEVQLKVGMTTDQTPKGEVVTKEGAEDRYVFDDEKRVVRMVKKDEGGGTLSEAKELLKMADDREKEGVESPFVQDEEGRWILNTKARVTGLDYMAVQFMQQSQADEQPVPQVCGYLCHTLYFFRG